MIVPVVVLVVVMLYRRGKLFPHLTKTPAGTQVPAPDNTRYEIQEGQNPRATVISTDSGENQYAVNKLVFKISYSWTKVYLVDSLGIVYFGLR